MGGKPKKTPYPCVICGRPIFNKWGRDPRIQTCKDPDCRADLKLHPEKADKSRRSGQNPKGKWNPRTKRLSITTMMNEWRIPIETDQHEALRIGALELADSAEWGSDEDWGTSRDLRGSARPDLQGEIWAWLSRKTALLKVIGSSESEAALVIHRKKTESVKSAVVRSLGILPSSQYLCDVFLAWRCPCPEDHRVTYEKIDDLPNKAGYHNPCPRCGAAPLEVKNVH